MKNIIALAAVAVATVAGASTNYVELAAKSAYLPGVVRNMTQDPELSDPAAFRAALEAVDKVAATSGVVRSYQCVPRCCPLTARAVLGRTECLSERVRKAMLAVCGYETSNDSLGQRRDEDEYLNYCVQAGCCGSGSPATARSAILNAAIVPARRLIRAEGGSFVGKDGAARVKAILDGLAAELNAPRFGKADEITARLGLDIEWEFAKSHLLSDEKVAELKRRLLDGEIAFNWTLQGQMCAALGVEAYNAFVKEYNGTDSCRK